MERLLKMHGKDQEEFRNWKTEVPVKSRKTKTYMAGKRTLRPFQRYHSHGADQVGTRTFPWKKEPDGVEIGIIAANLL